MEVHLTNRCQLNCLYCSFENRNRDYTIRFSALEKVLKDFVKLGGKSILWSGGGEPTLYRNNLYTIKDAIDCAYEVGLKQGLYTNGNYMKDILIECILEKCTFIRFSMAAFTKNKYSEIHRYDGYKKIVENISTCMRKKSVIGSNIDIGISYIMCKNNTFDLKNVFKFLEKVKPDYIYFKPAVYDDFSKINLFLQKEMVRYIKSRINKNGLYIEFSEQKSQNLLLNTMRKYRHCYIGNLFPTIAANGDIYNCCHHIGNKKYLMGNIYLNDLKTVFSKIHIVNDFAACPPNCRGDIINEDISIIETILENKHSDFL